MRNATQEDKSTVIAIIKESFQNNPSVVSVVNPKKPNSLGALANYAFETGLSRDGVFLSDDQQCTAICYQYNYKKDDFKDYWNQLLLVLKCIGISNISTVLKREAYINKLRPKDGQFLYFWFFGATEKGIKMRSVYELKKHIFDLSKNLNLPIYLETSVPKNQKIYQRFGFEIYHTWGQSEQTTLWFMKREPR